MAKAGDRLSGDVLNSSREPLQMHWHGQIKAPANQDRARPDGGTLGIGQADTHDFELTSGTHWLHSHSPSEQQLLAAPVVAIEEDVGDVQNIVVLLHDFAFRSPKDIFAEVTNGGAHAHVGGGMMMGMTHANDVNYDARLANDCTLADPKIVSVEKGGGVRLRIINGGTAGASNAKLSATADKPQALTDLAFETQLQPTNPLIAKPADKAFMIMLGEELEYRWTINGRVRGEHQPSDVSQRERVELTFMNPSSAMHPMHLHGHHFHVASIGE